MHNFLLVNNCLTLSSFIVVKNLDQIAKFSHVNTRRKYAFFHRVFLGEISKFAAETSHIASDSPLFTETR